jgi:hypothetical protein
MQYASDYEEADASVRQLDSSLGAFIVYEDVAAGKRAKETCDVLAETLGADWQIEIEMSSFKSLLEPRMRRYAATAVTNADLVVFSCLDRDLPFEVWQWTELCLKRPARPTALLALLTGARGPTGAPRAVEKYLAELAQRRGMQFFSHRHSPAADGAAIGQLWPVRQKEPNEDFV